MAEKQSKKRTWKATRHVVRNGEWDAKAGRHVGAPTYGYTVDGPDRVPHPEDTYYTEEHAALMARAPRMQSAIINALQDIEGRVIASASTSPEGTLAMIRELRHLAAKLKDSLPCDPPTACKSQGRCWTHSEWEDGSPTPMAGAVTRAKERIVTGVTPEDASPEFKFDVYDGGELWGCYVGAGETAEKAEADVRQHLESYVRNGQLAAGYGLKLKVKS